MRLSKDARVDYAYLIKKACGYLPSVFENGTFEFFDLDENTKDQVLAKLRNSEFVYAINDRLNKENHNYNISGILVENVTEYLLDEKFIVNKELNPKLWNSDNTLKKEVEEKILEIVDIFKQQLEADGVDLVIDDIHLVGSNANYNYTEFSDLDIHIIADQTSDCSSEHLSLIYNSYRHAFNNRYDIKLNGVNAEVYVENRDNPTSNSKGIYSLKDGWINDPAISVVPKIDEVALEKMIQKYEDKYLKVIENPSLEKIEAFINDLYDVRIDSLAKDGEFGLGNLLFKEMRNLNYLDELKDLKDQLISKQLSLN